MYLKRVLFFVCALMSFSFIQNAVAQNGGTLTSSSMLVENDVRSLLKLVQSKQWAFNAVHGTFSGSLQELRVSVPHYLKNSGKLNLVLDSPRSYEASWSSVASIGGKRYSITQEGTIKGIHHYASLKEIDSEIITNLCVLVVAVKANIIQCCV